MFLMSSSSGKNRKLFYTLTYIHTYAGAEMTEYIAKMKGKKIAAGEVEVKAVVNTEVNSASRIQVFRSLRRSRVRTEVALYLYKIYPEASYPSDICRHIGIEPTNILGALRGMNHRFDESNSLLGLGLVDKIGDNGATYYQLSEQGKSVLENLNLVVPVVK
jgi:predicted transcriptional regulator with HTH domain